MNIRQFFSIIMMSVLAFAGLTSCQPSSSKTNQPSQTASTTIGNIVFIRLDSITNQYTALQEVLEVLEAKAAVAEKAQNDRVTAFQKDVASLQRRAQSGQMAPKQIGQEQERLAGREQTLMQNAQQVRQELETEQYYLMAEYEENLKKVLDELQAEANYDYILSYGAGTGVLTANDKNDITPEASKRVNLIPMDGKIGEEEAETEAEETTNEEG